MLSPPLNIFIFRGHSSYFKAESVQFISILIAEFSVYMGAGCERAGVSLNASHCYTYLQYQKEPYMVRTNKNRMGGTSSSAPFFIDSNTKVQVLLVLL